MTTVFKYERRGVYPIPSTLEFLDTTIKNGYHLWPNGVYAVTRDRCTVEFDGEMICALNDRFINFIQNGTTCAHCGLTGEYFALERNIITRNRTPLFHFNLYGLDGDGNEVMLLHEMIIPKKVGGTNEPANLQTICTRCRGLKGGPQ